jgi:hypothetical protein
MIRAAGEGVTTIIMERTYRKGCFPKPCGCGLVYEKKQWRELDLVGMTEGTDSTCGKRYGPDLELRNCVCGSTIAVPVEE